MNALVDEGVIRKLYEASKSGVKIDLIVRGSCSLIPGVKGLSENIRVVSIVDRYLEHSRIYYFSSSKQLYLSSADWMPRNFFSRLELAFPIEDPEIFKFIVDVVLGAYLADTLRCRELTAQGAWKKRSPSTLTVVQKKKAQELLKMSGSHQTQLRAQFFFEDLNSKQNSV
jgi:polyphosphate kinase